MSHPETPSDRPVVLEPFAEARRASHSLSDGEAAALSQAISLKRIADALSGEGANILTQPINAYGENIAQAIQGQLDRGGRDFPAS